MKKLIACLLVGITGFSIVACNSGSGSTGGGGGDQTQTVPTDYSASIPSGGTLISSNNLQIASNATAATLSFGVQNITVDTTVSFTVSPSAGVAGNVPTISPQSCSFTANNPQPCQVTLNVASSSVGKYIITPSVNTINLAAINFSTATSSTITLPDGTYTSTVTANADYSGSCGTQPWYGTAVIANGQMCVTETGSGTTQCRPNLAIPSPSGSNPFSDGYLTNSYWNGTKYSGYFTPTDCPGLLLENILIKN